MRGVRVTGIARLVVLLETEDDARFSYIRQLGRNRRNGMKPRWRTLQKPWVFLRVAFELYAEVIKGKIGD